jgi:hypothetical protein
MHGGRRMAVDDRGETPDLPDCRRNVGPLLPSKHILTACR